MPIARRLLSAIALLASSLPPPAAAQDVTRIENVATLSFTEGSGARTVRSNTVVTDVTRTKTPTRLSFRLPPPDHLMTGSQCETDPALKFSPAPIDAATLGAAAPLMKIDERQPFILLLENPGGNHDPDTRETASIRIQSGATRVAMPLLETAPDSGFFAGGISPAGANPANAPCDPRLSRGADITLSFDEDDYSYASTVTELIDPTGYVFDAQTGALIDGARVTLLDDRDQPAIVFGDDGVSRYPATVVSGGSTTDASGRRYVFPQGNYRFPYVAAGRYHLRIEPPARYSAPSTRSRSDLATLRGPGGGAFLLNDASFGGVFALSTPDVFYADVPLDRAGEARLLLTKTASVREASVGDVVQYRVTLENRGDAAVNGIHLNDILPNGLRYERGSHRGSGAPTVSADGRTLDFPIARLAAGASVEVRYVVTIAPGAPTGEAVNRVLASGSDRATSNEAAAAVRIVAPLFTDGFTMTGRVTQGDCGDPVDRRIGVAGVRLVMEDGRFVVTDRDGLYHFEGVRPGRHVVQLDANALPASHVPVACDIDTRQAGNATSRFVESDGGLLKRVDFQLKPTGKVAAGDTLPVTIADDATAAGNRDWLSGQAPGVEMLFPGVDHNPRAPVLRVVVKHRPGQRVALLLGGQPVDPLAFDATDTAGDVAISRWTGLPLVEGDNRLTARVLDSQSEVVSVIERTVHSASTASEATIDTARSRLVADGVTHPLIAVRLTDRTGRPVRAGTTVAIRVEPPYAVATDPTPPPAGAGATARVVGDDGLAFVALDPTVQAGAVRLAVSLADDRSVRTRDLRTWLSASARDWVVVGFGSGTLGYRTLDRYSRALARGDGRAVVTDGQLALYAKGRIRGRWLATIAYDSARVRDRSRGLLGTIDLDRYYTVYGDGSRAGFDAPTERKLYVRLEAPEFTALFGDFETGLTATRLGRYSRTLNGAQIAYQGPHVAVMAFAADTDELYARDEIPGNGLSGPYRLSGRDIVPNSDKLRIEVRDRLRPEVVLSATAMTRHIDYDIDAAAGTIRFRAPVLTRDIDRNPIVIVVDYETYGRSRKLTAGARAAARIGRIDVGATSLLDRTAGEAALIAADLHAQVTRTTEVRAEAATGGRGGLSAGRAFLAEVEHHGPALDLLAYARRQDARFGVGQQNIVEAGQSRIGLDGRLRLGNRVSLTGSAWHQDALDGLGTRSAADIRLDLQRRRGTIFVGGQLASDREPGGLARDSRLLTIGGTQAVLDGRLTLGAQTQIAPGGNRASRDFPVRHQRTAGWRLHPGVRLIGGYEVAQGREMSLSTAQVGLDVAPWTGAKAMSTLNQQAAGENGDRTFAQYGLSQSLAFGPRWAIDATLDASTTVSGTAPVRGSQPLIRSTGSLIQGDTGGDYTAITLGAGYRADLWSWTGRIEYRASDDGQRLGITTALLRRLGEGRTLASHVRWYRASQPSGAIAASAVADVALAWRPLDSRWSLLDRFELRHERADAGFDGGNVLGVPAYGGGYQATLRAINTLALNYRTGPEGLGHGTEATLYYGAKWVRGGFGGDDYGGFVDVIGLDIRRDLDRHVDVGIQASVQHAWSRGSVAFGGGPTIGVSPARDLWLTAGYNIAGYRDRDFEADRYTRKGPFVTLRMKIDQTSIGRVGRALWSER